MLVALNVNSTSIIKLFYNKFINLNYKHHFRKKIIEILKLSIYVFYNVFYPFIFKIFWIFLRVCVVKLTIFNNMAFLIFIQFLNN